MARSLTSRNLLDKKHKRLLQILDGALAQVVGEATKKGCWVIYGVEKNGKTWLALQIAKILAKTEKVSYISAEEGLDKSFTDACERVNITANDKILWDEYISIDDIIDKFSKPKTPDIIIIDNLTIYADEIKPSELRKRLLNALPNKLIIFLAHEDRKEASPAVARMAKKLAKVIIHVSGLCAEVTSRFGAGGTLIIDEEKARLIWGEQSI